MNRPISEVMQFAIDLNSSSLLELLYTVKDCIPKRWKQFSFVGSVEEISVSCILEACNVQCNRALIWYFKNILLLLLLLLF
jgi:hypothetical protein